MDTNTNAINDVLGYILDSAQAINDQVNVKQEVLGQQLQAADAGLAARTAQIPTEIANAKSLQDTIRNLAINSGMDASNPNSEIVKLMLGMKQNITESNAVRQEINDGEKISFWKHPGDWILADISRPGLVEQESMLNNHIAQAAAQAAALYSTFDTVAEHQKIIATKLNEAYWVDEQKKLTSEIGRAHV